MEKKSILENFLFLKHYAPSYYNLASMYLEDEWNEITK
jgi:hypothetical protein